MHERRLSICLALFAAGCMARTDGPQDATEESDFALTGGTVYKLTLPKMTGDTGNCADVAGASLNNGANIQEWDCNGSGAQSFKAIDLGNGYFQLQNTNSGKCVDIYGATTITSGSNIQQYACKTSSLDNQSWKFVSYNGFFQIKSKWNDGTHGSGFYCVDVQGGGSATANGTNIALWPCGSSTSTTLKGNQTFNPVVVSSGGGGGGGGTIGNFPARFSAPYVPTWNNTNLANLASSTGNKFWTLAFILSNGSCTPTWNGDTCLTCNSYGSYINSLRTMGGDVIASFGGAEGRELGQACGDVSSLQSAYQKVINQFGLKWLDLDIESGAESDSTSVDRRNQALRNLQAANPGLHVSYTLGVDRSGLPSAQLNVLKNAKSRGVTVNVVNIMAMDYGPCYSDMGQAAIDAANATQNQLVNNGISAKVGVTPMIGVNDVTCEVFRSSDASLLVNYAQSHSFISLLAYWSQDADPNHTYINIFKTFH